ncbi:MAG TPA: DUF86 domain-containing protein [Methanosarcinales archaeon]|nr:DUF86 domain-containing protein [Methanosarcinales archaeon]
MNAERLKRYNDKLNHISKRVFEIKEWNGDYSIDAFIADERTKLATYKAFQEIVDAIMDIAAMICKDSKITPSDDYTNIDALYENRIISKNVQKTLIESNGLRNRLVHWYNKIDDALAFESIQTLIPNLEKFMEEIKNWIKKKLKKD